ncbi:MAG TPA: arsenic resistance N-acetyltransferase ArsN2 [Gemmatimonadaceae bacterium]|nr:arsenic resistance N-acetyltransferase ArsN2 [Gemmatimonadaceae bacterium]
MPTLPLAPQSATSDASACCGPDCGCNDTAAGAAATTTADDLTATVRDKYGAAAQRVLDSAAAAGGCCGPVNSCCGGAAFDGTVDPITAGLYVLGETDELPEAAVLASLGCGNPTALAELHEGEVVLDLGSGGGIDVLLSARRVGPTGKAYGLDMTDEMLALAARNAAEAGVTNVEFLRGRIEEIPLPGNSVDVIISNCVINLSGDKARVIREAFRVLKPGGRFAVSDVVVRGELPADVKRSMELWVGCVAGALQDAEFVSLLSDAGFASPSVEMTRVYEVEDARAFLVNTGLDVDRVAAEVAGRVGAAFVRATKPAAFAMREARPDDIDAVERLLTDAALPVVGVREALAHPASGFVVAESDGIIVGVGGLETCCDDVLLRSVAVRPEWRSRGVGRALVTRLIAEAEANGRRALYLLTTTAERYFPSFGFQPVAREAVPEAVRATAEFRDACPATAVAMVRPVQAHG